MFVGLIILSTNLDLIHYEMRGFVNVLKELIIWIWQLKYTADAQNLAEMLTFHVPVYNRHNLELY